MEPSAEQRIRELEQRKLPFLRQQLLLAQSPEFHVGAEGEINATAEYVERLRREITECETLIEALRAEGTTS